MKAPLAAIAFLLLQAASWQLIIKIDPDGRNLTVAILHNGDAKVLRVDFQTPIQ